MPEQRTTPHRGNRGADLLAAASTLFLERGIAGTTMEDIARTAGAGKATLYRYFANRDAVLDALVTREAARFERAVRTATDGQPTCAGRLEAAFVAGVRFLATHPMLTRGRDEEPGLLLPRLTAAGGPVVRGGLDLFQSLVQDGIDAGEFREVDTRAAAEVAMRLILSYFSFPPMYLRVEDEDNAHQFARELISGALLRNGVA